MSLLIPNSQQEIDRIIKFLRQTFQSQKKEKAIIAVSGGIDSALSISLLARTLPKESVHAVLLPYGDQSIVDSRAICDWNTIPEENIHIINIKTAVEQLENTLFSTPYRLDLSEQTDQFRLGNMMARTRMIFLYDLAKKLDALVCGTENKSEKYLAYFTRFGDEASDIEPIQHLYKTQVRQLVEHLQMPKQFLSKAPSAGLWQGQTDESELGFSYHEADVVMEQYIDGKKNMHEIKIKTVNSDVVQKVIARIDSQHFKHEVPYTLE